MKNFIIFALGVLSSTPLIAAPCGSRPSSCITGKVLHTTDISAPPSRHMPDGLQRCWLKLSEVLEIDSTSCRGPGADEILHSSLDLNCDKLPGKTETISGVVSRLPSGYLEFTFSECH